MLSGLLGLLKQLLDSFFPLSTQYKGKPSRREGSLSFARTWMNFPFQSLYDCWKMVKIDLPAIGVQTDPKAIAWVFGLKQK